MKRLSYVTMVFLPASFVANAFSMNVVELNPGGYTTLVRFIEAMVPLTIFTIWTIVAFQNQLVLQDDRGGKWRVFLWPIIRLRAIISWFTTKKHTLTDDIHLQYQ